MKGLLAALGLALAYALLCKGIPFKGCGVGAGAAGAAAGAAAAGAWPWIVALLRDADRHYCGGALIGSRHVLTAAHCLQPFQVDAIKVRIGEYDLEQSDESRHMDLKASAWHIHEKYDSATYEHDIAVMTLESPVTFNTLVAPICMPPDQDFENATATVIGWGTLFYGGPSSNVLMEVAIPVWNLEDCAERFTQPIRDTNLCAGAYEGGKDSCQGDSGGPLMYYNNDRWISIGVVSWGIMCGQPMRPGVYTRVSKYLQWISDKTTS